MKANDRLTYMTSEAWCLSSVEEKGYIDQYQVRGLTLFCLDNLQIYRPEEIQVINFYRFEGISNPDDMSIIYAIETSDGRKGALVDASGVYADHAVGDLMNEVQRFRKITSGGENRK